MPPNRTSTGASSSKPFKPPHPSTASTTISRASKQTTTTTGLAQASSSRAKPAKPSTSTSARRSNPTQVSSSFTYPTNADEADDAEDIGERSTGHGDRNRDRDTDDREEEEQPKSRIPPDLLTRLLHEFFTDEGVRISKGADRAVGKYMETFVREAICRAAFEKKGMGMGAGDRFMEVEDLEKLAPQLVLDF